MKLEQLRDMAAKDAVIDPLDLGGESLRTHQLHNKYLVLFEDAKMRLRLLEKDRNVLFRDKHEYYSGRMAEDDLASRGWKPFQLRLLRSDLETYINADADVIKLGEKIDMVRGLVSFLEATIKMINGRDWSIRNAIEFGKFVNGVK